MINMKCPSCGNDKSTWHQGYGEAEGDFKALHFCIWYCEDCDLEFWVESKNV